MNCVVLNLLRDENTCANIGYHLINWIYHNMHVAGDINKCGLLSGKIDNMYYSRMQW